MMLELEFLDPMLTHKRKDVLYMRLIALLPEFHLTIIEPFTCILRVYIDI